MAGERLTARAVLERLVAFDTVSAHSNLELIHWIRDYLAGWGIDSTLAPNEEGTKANLFATIEPVRASGTGRDGGQDGGIVLSGHTDVVPVAGQDWTSYPFEVVERDGRLYGRGTADMKGFIAIALALVPDMLATRPKIPLHFAFSFDEEVGCIGVPRLLEKIGAGLPRPRLAIIGEPTSLKVVNAHKGISAQTTTILGSEAHSSQTHRAVSAVMYASRLIGFIAGLAERYRDAPRDDRFDPPFTTFNIGTIHGGEAVNIVPRHCRFAWELRPVPGVDPTEALAEVDAFVRDELLPEMRAIHPEAAIDTVVEAHAPPLSPESEPLAENLIKRLTGQNSTTTVSFASEAGLFQMAGMSAVLCGPGSIDQAHKPDEYITLEQFTAGEAFVRKIIAWAAEDGTV